jgi:hypothetical protein
MLPKGYLPEDPFSGAPITTLATASGWEMKTAWLPLIYVILVLDHL